ncbi:MAG TPA: hypothetical protein VMQ93_00930 [Novosphingobium sp.]|nr:hypothetical protein [Novosphingobium sp.]
MARDWLARAQALGPMIDAAARADESACELSPEVVRAIDAAGLFAMMAPAALGGGEAHPADLINVIAELSFHDGSAGWYAHAVMTGGAVAGSLLGTRAVAAIFPGGRYGHVAGQAAPTGRAVREGDGYRVSGRYAFGSGTAHAGHVVGGFVLQDRDGAPTMLIGMVPREGVRFLGNWEVMGLRATGSYDFEVPEQVIHADFVHDPANPREPRGGALYRMGMMALPCLSHGAFAIGATRRVLHEWTLHARGRRTPGGRAMCESEAFHRDIALAEADARAAEAYLRRTFDRLFVAASGGEVPEPLRLDGRLAASHAFVVAMRVGQAAYAACTTTPLRNGHTLQRAFRDICAGNAHFLTAAQSLTDAGRVIAGAEGAALVF